MMITKRWAGLFCAASALSFTVACGDDDGGGGTTDADAGGTETEDPTDTDPGTETEDPTDTDPGTETEDPTDTDEPMADAGADSGMPPVELPEVEAVCAGLEGEDQADCGGYIVNSLVPCGDCHTPRGPDGQPIEGMHLAGNSIGPLFDFDPENDEVGEVWVPNLTPDEDTGLGDWTAEEIKNAFQNGVRPDGSFLNFAMPYAEFHNILADDADAIVAYLMSIPAVENDVPETQGETPFAVPPIALEAFPQVQLDKDDPEYEEAVRGLYLAGYTGACVSCHTGFTPMFTPDLENMFAGGRIFDAATFGIPSPPFPAQIYSSNITPHGDGIEGWTKEAIVRVLKEGVDDEGENICPPMPVGPMAAFGGLTDSDAEAIATYLLNIEGKANPTGEAYPECVAPDAPPPMTDGGVPDAGPETDADVPPVDSGTPPEEDSGMMSEPDASVADGG